MKNKYKNNKTFIFIFILLMAGFFGFKISLAENSDIEKNYENILITEIMHDPEGTNSKSSDWIELYNPTKNNILLEKKNFGIIDEEELKPSSDGSRYLNCHTISQDIMLESGGFAIIAENENNFKNLYSNINNLADSAFGLSSDGDYIRLSNDRCVTFFYEMSYKNSWGAKDNGKTLEKIDFEKDDSEDNWQESYVSGGTPGQPSSQKPDPKNYDFNLLINEIFPAPDSGEDEYIELFNNENEDIDLSGWIIRDASRSGKYVFPDKTKISSQGYLIIYKKDSGLSLNNSGDESVMLINPADVEISRLNYKGSKKSFSYSFDGSAWRWTSQPTPAAVNLFDKILSGKISMDGKIYAGIYADFSVQTDKDARKFTWDFGDSHKSYLKETRHKYEKAGKYDASLKITGNGEDKIYYFTVAVEKYDAPKIRITKIVPNPEGNDTENETIFLINKSKKKINLKGWSIATGWKNLYNHPIREDFEIKAGKIKELKRDICAFTLNNAKTKIELRDPTGKVVQEIGYDREENKIEEGEIYEKIDSKWIWQESETNEELAPADTENDSQNDLEDQDNNETDFNISPEELAAALGKYSVSPVWQNKNANRIQLISYATGISLPGTTQGSRVLGAEKIRNQDGYYLFTSPVSQKHWTEKLLEYLWMKINLFINLFINKVF